MIGIQQIASHIPKTHLSNYDLKSKFNLDDRFIRNKIGFEELAVKAENQNTSDLCLEAFLNLTKKITINKNEIDTLILVTQNPDQKIPHTSAILHNKLGLGKQCACFDISQGCAGYVHGLSIAKSFMQANQLHNGLLFTCDPYSGIIDRNDKNTAILFGDGAAVTLLGNQSIYNINNFSFGTLPNSCHHLTCVNETLSMNGREIFNFAVREVPKDVQTILEKNNLKLSNIDKFLFHPGSKYIIDILRTRLQLPEEKTPFEATKYGNLVSSSLPVMLEKCLCNSSDKTILLCGFGVGLSWGSVILRRGK